MIEEIEQSLLTISKMAGDLLILTHPMLLQNREVQRKEGPSG